MRGLILLLLFAAPAKKAAVLTWADSVNPSGTTYTVYRAGAPCSDLPAMSKLAGPLTAMTYTDEGIRPNRQYCYGVTATSNGIESQSSERVTVTVPKGGKKPHLH